MCHPVPKSWKHMVPEPEQKPRFPSAMLFPTRLCSFHLMLRLNHQVLFQSLETLVSSCQPWLATVCERVLGGDVPLLSPQLHQLCWSLRDSQDERINLNAEIQGKRPTPRAQPGEKEDPKPAGGVLFRVFWVGVACTVTLAPLLHSHPSQKCSSRLFCPSGC